MCNLNRGLVLICTWLMILFVAAQALGSSAGIKRHYLIGLQLYTVRDDCAKDFPGTLKAVAQMGYSGVEFAGYYGRSARELRSMLAEDHLNCYGTHITLDALLGDEFDKTVAFNQELGNRMLVIPWLPPERMNSRAAILATAELFNRLARKLAPYNIVLAYHNHMTEFKPVEGELPWDTFFSHTDPRVAIEFDTGNALEAGAQAAPFLAKYPGRVLSVHVKDYSASKPQALLGEGDENWSEVLPLIKGRAGTRWFIIEQETYPFPPLACAEKCLHTFEKMLDRRS